MPKKQRIYDYFYEFASEALHIVIFENFVKSMMSCSSKLKVTPTFRHLTIFIFKGGDDHQFEADIGRLKSCVSNIMSECYRGINSNLVKDDYVHEVCRYGAAEPHALAALIGGCAAHEAIKLLTKQYVPIDNLFLFNSMTMNTVTLKIA